MRSIQPSPWQVFAFALVVSAVKGDRIIFSGDRPRDGFPHLHSQRDEDGSGQNGSFNFSSEAANAQRLSSRAEVFPEPCVDQEFANDRNLLDNEVSRGGMEWHI